LITQSYLQQSFEVERFLLVCPRAPCFDASHTSLQANFVKPAIQLVLTGYGAKPCLSRLLCSLPCLCRHSVAEGKQAAC
jgi:hypothetical protein